jgi:hemolysin III
MPGDLIHPFGFRHPVSAVTHLLFCGWAVYVTAVFRRLTTGDRARQMSASIFGASMVLLYGASGLYHAIPATQPRWIALFRRLDLAAIHVLIAGTCTAIFAVLPAGRPRHVPLALVWAVAAAGAVSKALPALPDFSITLALYVASAAIGCLPVMALARMVGARGLFWIVGGAAVYATGATCEALRWPVPVPGIVGYHEILHVCDMIGTSGHVVFVVRYVVRARQEHEKAMI